MLTMLDLEARNVLRFLQKAGGFISFLFRYKLKLIPVFLDYRQVSNIRRTKFQHLKNYRTVLWLSLPNPLKPDVKSSSWSSADRRCSNYIWVIDNFIAY